MALFFAPWLVISNKERLYASSGGGLRFRDKAAGIRKGTSRVEQSGFRVYDGMREDIKPGSERKPAREKRKMEYMIEDLTKEDAEYSQRAQLL